MLRAEDVVLAISNSGETDELNAILPTLKRTGLRIIGMTGGHDSTLAKLSDVVLDCGVKREACPLGLAPTASTTATLALGDALASCLITWNRFEKEDFAQRHPGGSLGQRLSGCVRELMHTDGLPVLGESVSLGEALVALNEGGLGALALVDENNQLSGILTDGDVRRALCSGETDPEGAVSAVMTKAPASVLDSTSSAEVLDVMEEREITVMPVVDDAKRLVGMIHLHDLLGKGHLKFSG